MLRRRGILNVPRRRETIRGLLRDLNLGSFNRGRNCYRIRETFDAVLSSFRGILLARIRLSPRETFLIPRYKPRIRERREEIRRGSFGTRIWFRFITVGIQSVSATEGGSSSILSPWLCAFTSVGPLRAQNELPGYAHVGPTGRKGNFGKFEPTLCINELVGFEQFSFVAYFKNSLAYVQQG